MIYLSTKEWRESHKSQLKENYNRWISNPDNKAKHKKYNQNWEKAHRVERNAYWRRKRAEAKAKLQAETSDPNDTDSTEN